MSKFTAEDEEWLERQLRNAPPFTPERSRKIALILARPAPGDSDPSGVSALPEAAPRRT